MTPWLRACALSLCIVPTLCTLGIPASAQTADPRTVVTLPAPIAEAFRAEMRGHMRSLDDILYALSDGDYAEAANVADLRWDFGHRMWEALADQGVSAEEIAQRKAQMREAMRASGMTPGQGMGMGGGAGQGMGMGMGGGMGLGRFMPEAIRTMGQGFHQAGQRFAAAARAMGDDPTLEDQRALLGTLQEVTTYCRACHDTFRVVAEGEP